MMKQFSRVHLVATLASLLAWGVGWALPPPLLVKGSMPANTLTIIIGIGPVIWFLEHRTHALDRPGAMENVARRFGQHQ